MIRKITKYLVFSFMLISTGSYAFDNTNILVEQAVNHIYMQRYQEAHRALKEAYEQSPRHPGVHFNLGRLFELTGNIGEALKEYGIAASLDTSMVAARRGMARCSVELKRQQAVIAQQNAAVRQTQAFSSTVPVNIPAQIPTQSQTQASTKVQAPVVNQKAEKTNPVYSATSDLKLPTLPAKVVKQASKITEEDKAEKLFNEGKNSEAKALLESILEKNQDSPKAHYLLGKVLSNDGELFPAISHLEEAVRVDEKYYDAYYMLGRNYSRVNLLEDSLRNYLIYYKARPQQQVAMEIGKVYETLGNTAMANSYYSKANNLNPGNVFVQQRINETAVNEAYETYLKANNAFQTNKFQEAYQLYNQAINTGNLSETALKDAKQKVEVARFRLMETVSKAAEYRKGWNSIQKNIGTTSLKYYQLNDASLKSSFADGVLVEWRAYVAKSFTQYGRDCLLMIKELDQDELDYLRYPENSFKLNKHYNNPGLFVLEAKKGELPSYAKPGNRIAFNGKTEFRYYDVLNEMGSTVRLPVMTFVTAIPIR